MSDGVRKVSKGVLKVSDGEWKGSDGERRKSYAIRVVSHGERKVKKKVRNVSDEVTMVSNAGCFNPRFFWSILSPSPAQNMINVRARAGPSSEIPIPSEPKPISAPISNLCLSPNKACLEI